MFPELGLRKGGHEHSIRKCVVGIKVKAEAGGRKYEWILWDGDEVSLAEDGAGDEG